MHDLPAVSTIETWEIADLLPALVDKSLVTFDETTGRYDLLETARQYARNRLMECADAATWSGRHAEYFSELTEQAEPLLQGPEQQTWLERLETEHLNLRAVLEWSAQSDPEVGLKLAGAISVFWYVRSYFGEGRARLAEVLARADPGQRTGERARALAGSGLLAYWQADLDNAERFYAESLSIRREIGDQASIAASLRGMGTVQYHRGNLGAARKLLDESLAIYRELDYKWGIAVAIGYLGFVARDESNYESAREHFEESLRIHRDLGDRLGIAASLRSLGNLAIEHGDRSAARAALNESLEIYRLFGDKFGICYSLSNLGALAMAEGDLDNARALINEGLSTIIGTGDKWAVAISLMRRASVAIASGDTIRALRLWGAAEQIREDVGGELPLSLRARFERDEAVARNTIGDDEAFAAAWQNGRGMTLEQATELALREGSD